MRKRLAKIIYWVACFILTSGLSTYAAESSFHGSHHALVIAGR